MTRLLLLIGFLFSLSVYGSPDIPPHIPPAETPPPATKSVEQRHFAELEEFDEIFMQAALEANDIEFAEGWAYKSIEDQMQTDTLTGKALATIEKIRESANIVNQLKKGDLLNLPVGIDKQIGNCRFLIGIANAKLYPTYAELEAYMVFEIPNKPDKKLAFGARKVKFNFSTGILDGKLQLLTDFDFGIIDTKLHMKLRGGFGNDKGTYVSFDCNGFKEMYLDSEIQFASSWIQPVNEKGEIKVGEMVKTEFKTYFSDWNDMFVEISLPPFKVSSYKDATFWVQGVTFDFSDFRNSPSMKFPDEYLAQNTQIVPGNINSWRGVYFRHLKVQLNKAFNSKKTNKPTEFEAEGLFIDNQGFTGRIKSRHPLPLDEGDMEGWAFSIDSVEVNFLANEITDGGLAGSIVLPVSDNPQKLAYSAQVMGGGEYAFLVKVDKKLEFDMFSASHVTLFKNSYVDVKLKNENFTVKAMLNGKMDIGLKDGNKKGGKTYGELAKVQFQELMISNKKPYFAVKAFSAGAGDGSKIGKFPLSIDNLSIKTVEDVTELKVDVKIAIAGKESGSFAAVSGISVKGKMEEDRSGEQHWKLVGARLHKASIDIDQGAFGFYGAIELFRKDPDYGDGFSGKIKARFEPGIEVTATAMFGKVEEMRYWYVDAMVKLAQGIPIIAPLEINGFGGGAYYHMSPKGKNKTDSLIPPSGRSYIPDKNVSLGVKASVSLATSKSEQAFNGQATFEMIFNKRGGLNYLGFYGMGRFLSLPIPAGTEKLASNLGKAVEYNNTAALGKAGDTSGLAGEKEFDKNKADEMYEGQSLGESGSITGGFDMNYNFESNEFHANFEVFVNIAGGLMQGIGEKGKAGWAEIYVGKGDWYIYVGTPDNPNGLKVGVGGIALQTKSYFMAGTKVKSSPPPPTIISDILGIDSSELDYMRELNALGDGKGFAFGSSLDFNTGELTFPPFYASFHAGLGFDVMLKNYGSAKCKGRSGKIGVNGWYANGQVYGYFKGDIGLKIDLWIFKGKKKILEIGAAALLQAKLPNPFWMRGMVGGYYSVLGGRVKGNCKFDFTLGEECELVGGSVLEGTKIISALTPNDGSRDVNVFVEPQAVFDVEMNAPMEFIENDGSKKTYRFDVEYFRLLDKNKQPVTGELIWNDENNVLVLDTDEILPPKQDLTAEIKIVVKEKIGNTWKILKIDGKEFSRIKTAKFKSGEAPDFIPDNNVTYSYPIKTMQNFYVQEYPTGYIKLNDGQGYLFDTENKWKFEAQFKTSRGTYKSSISYDTSEKQVSFPIPSDLPKGFDYELKLMKVPLQETTKDIDANVDSVESVVSVGANKQEITLKDMEVKGNLEQLESKELHTLIFRSSKFATFSSKVDHFVFESNRIVFYFDKENEKTNYSYTMSVSFYSYDEAFSDDEIQGYDEFKPLIRQEATLDNDWYQKTVGPNIYAPAKKLNFTTQGTSKYGFPPVKGVTKLKELFAKQRVYHQMNWQVRTDFIELKSQAALRYVKDGNRNAKTILDLDALPDYDWGTYKVKLDYILPGRTNPNSTKNINVVRL